jgi:mannose-1-phosphate guanylyltransferase
MILAAGRGTRLGALGKRVAKALVEVGGEPLLARQLRYLRDNGVERAVVNASHLADQIEAFATDWTGGPELEVAIEAEPLGTAGGVRNALDRFSDDPLLVLYGDVIAREDLGPLGDLHQAERPLATIAVYHSDGAQEKGVVDLDGTLVTAFHEKDPARTSGWVNAGVYVIEPSWLRPRPVGEFLDFGFDLFPAALAGEGQIRAHRLAEPVLDVGTPADLARAQEAT